jgi:hypothetical protein
MSPDNDTLGRAVNDYLVDVSTPKLPDGPLLVMCAIFGTLLTIVLLVGLT